MKNILVGTATIAALLLSSSCGKITGSTCSAYGFNQDNGASLKIKAGLSQTNDTNSLSIAQSFKVGSNIKVKNMYLPLDRVGRFPAATYLLTLTIEGDNGAAAAVSAGTSDGPNGVPLAGAQATLDPHLVSTAKAPYLFNFNSPVALTAGTTYWLRLNANYPANGTNYIEWRGYEGPHGFANGGATEEVQVNQFSNAGAGQLQAMDFVPGC